MNRRGFFGLLAGAPLLAVDVPCEQPAVAFLEEIHPYCPTCGEHLMWVGSYGQPIDTRPHEAVCYCVLSARRESYRLPRFRKVRF